MIILIKLIINALAIYITAQVIPNVSLNGLQSALVVALVLGLINAIIKPILMFLTLPINMLSLGLFTFVINAVMIILASKIVDGFSIPSFWSALAFSIILSMVSSILTWIAK